MNRRPLLKSLALAAFGASFYIFGVSPASAAAFPGEKPLSVGETLHYDSGLDVTFLGVVRKESRFPINVGWMWADDSEVVLRVKPKCQGAMVVSIHTYLEPQIIVIQAYPPTIGVTSLDRAYYIRIGSLTPGLYTGRKTLQSDYRLNLRIELTDRLLGWKVAGSMASVPCPARPGE